MRPPVQLQRQLEAKVQQAQPDDSANEQTARTVAVLVGSTFLTKTADTLASPKIVLTALLQTMGASSIAVSALVPLRESGALLPQIWLAGLMARYHQLGPLYSAGALLQGLAAAGMLLSAWQLEGQQAGWAIVFCLGVLSIARALCSISFKGVLGKCVPSGLRGQTTGWASSAAGVATIILSLALLVLPDYATVDLFAVFLALAALCWCVAAALFTRVNEKDDSQQQDEKVSIVDRLSLLRENPSFRRFVIVRSLLVSTALVAPWYVLLSVSTNAVISSVGSLLLASGLASFISSPFWGRYSDRSSRWVLQVSALSVASLGLLTLTINWLVPGVFKSIWLVPFLYFLLQIAHQGVRVARKTYVVDLANDGNRVDYVSISNTLIGVIILVMGLVSGLLSIWLEPIGMIVLYSIAAGIGAWAASLLPEAREQD